MINIISTMLVALAVLGDIANGIGHHRQSHTLMTVHPVTANVHAMDAVTGAVPGPRTAPNPTPLWRVVVR